MNEFHPIMECVLKSVLICMFFRVHDEMFTIGFEPTIQGFCAKAVKVNKMVSEGITSAITGFVKA